MIFREATIADIDQMMVVRFAVKENVLSNPALVTPADCEHYITNLGKGWVCTVDNEVKGFAIADLQNNSVWALFVTPEFENKGIGKKLHRMMLDWYFTHTQKTIWLSTAYNTRAAAFYHHQGWKEAGAYSEKELKFEMDYKSWSNKATAGT